MSGDCSLIILLKENNEQKIHVHCGAGRSLENSETGLFLTKIKVSKR